MDERVFPDPFTAVFKEAVEVAAAAGLPLATAWVEALCGALAANGRFSEPALVALGGGGILLRVCDGAGRRVLKLPRGADAALREAIAREGEALLGLNDPALPFCCGVLTLAVDGGVPVLVLEDLGTVRALDRELEARLGECAGRGLPALVAWLCGVLGEAARALAGLHASGYAHGDLKAGNLLVDGNGRARLLDLASWVRLGAPAAGRRLSTPFYAHPALTGWEDGSAPGSGYQAAWDLFAFGRTILELLALVDRRFPELVAYDAGFVALHLAACRLLDGHNRSPGESERLREAGRAPACYRETWFELDARALGELRIRSATELVGVFARLLEQDAGRLVPELRSQPAHSVLIGAGAAAPFSERVRRLIEHPVFSRLRAVPQLELLDSIYPTATHSRFEHALGTFHQACRYLRALCADAGNPLFRQLAGEEDLKAILLAALLHDLGQYPFGHTIEEGFAGYRHEQLGLAFLANPTRDRHGATIRELIEDPHHGWGVPFGRVRDLLDPEKRDPGRGGLFDRPDFRLRLFSSIIDGPIDVDKLDYLLRDGAKCGLPYGAGIDDERLVSCLTVVLDHDADGCVVPAIGTYEKGQAAAESLSFARYLLYQTVYWHHSSRALRTMVRGAVAPLFGEGGKNAKKAIKEFEAMLGVAALPAAAGTREVLGFIEERTDGAGRELVGLLRDRRYYKRLLVLHESDGGECPLAAFRALVGREGFAAALQDALRVRFEAFLAGRAGPGVSLFAPERTDPVLARLVAPRAVLCDAPAPSIGARDKLHFVPTAKMILKNYAARGGVGRRVSDVWNQTHEQLMRIAARGHVFCHPEVRDVLLAAIGPEGVRRTLAETMRRFG